MIFEELPWLLQFLDPHDFICNARKHFNRRSQNINWNYIYAYDYIYEFIIWIMTDSSNLLGEDMMGKYSVS